MTAASGVPPVLRPVLEELRGFADAAWRGLASQDRVTAAWAGAMRDAITAALASDAGAPEPPPRGLRAMTEEEMAACEAVAAPEGEPFFHKLGCPKINGTAAHCTCPPDRERPEQTPPGVAEVEAFHRRVRELGSIEAVRELEAPAPDAELDRLLIEYARCQVQARYASRSQPELNRLAYAVEYAAAGIHAHVARVKREAREAGREAAAREFANDQGLVWREKGGA